MSILDEENQEIEDNIASTKNLKSSFLSSGLLILSFIAFFVSINSFFPGHNRILGWTLVILFYTLMSLAAFFAIITLKNSYTDMKLSKKGKNYFAVGISIAVLLVIVNEVFQLV